jgi:membrane-bound lytic murein transglycosylase D
MAAYNAGEGKILRALNRTKSDNYWALLNTRHIKKETKEYVPRFIAATLIATNPDEYGFTDLDYHPPLSYDEVVLDRPVDLDIAARCAETSLDMIRELNPEIRRWSTPANVSAYALRIPYGMTETFAENLSRISDQERFSISTYTVKKGDTLKKISTKTGIPVSVILELNDDGNGLKTLKAGKTISLPPKEKLCFDRDDREGKKSAKKRISKVRKQPHKKIVVTSLTKKQTYVND